MSLNRQSEYYDETLDLIMQDGLEAILELRMSDPQLFVRMFEYPLLPDSLRFEIIEQVDDEEFLFNQAIKLPHSYMQWPQRELSGAVKKRAIRKVNDPVLLKKAVELAFNQRVIKFAMRKLSNDHQYLKDIILTYKSLTRKKYAAYIILEDKMFLTGLLDNREQITFGTEVNPNYNRYIRKSTNDAKNQYIFNRKRLELLIYISRQLSDSRIDRLVEEYQNLLETPPKANFLDFVYGIAFGLRHGSIATMIFLGVFGLLLYLFIKLIIFIINLF